MTTGAIIGLILMIIGSYFIGNISFAIIFSKSKRLIGFTDFKRVLLIEWENQKAESDN